jgi:hypothetical protein
MSPIVRNVKDIGVDDRRSLEHVVGQHLQDDQQVVIHVVSIATTNGLEKPATVVPGTLPEWCNVYEGLTTDEIADVEAAALDRSHWIRPIA